MNGSEKAYKFGEKNNWRRWTWNRIVERLKTPPRDAVVLYLAGADDLDRAVALQHGFKEPNLIAVERSLRVCTKLRDDGKTVVHGNIELAANLFPDSKTVHVVVADLCCDFSFKTAYLLLGSTLRNTEVVAANFMRGRGADTSRVRQRFPGFKHRGEFLYLTYVSLLAAACPHPNLSAAKLFRVLRPAFNSYQSGRLFFDSCVLAAAPQKQNLPPFRATSLLIRNKYPAAIRKVSAAAAVHTMRATN